MPTISGPVRAMTDDFGRRSSSIRNKYCQLRNRDFDRKLSISSVYANIKASVSRGDVFVRRPVGGICSRGFKY